MAYSEFCFYKGLNMQNMYIYANAMHNIFVECLMARMKIAYELKRLIILMLRLVTFLQNTSPIIKQC